MITVREAFLHYRSMEFPLIDLAASFQLENGFWLLTGDSGIGKTSFLRLLSGWFTRNEKATVNWKIACDWDVLSDVDFVGSEGSLFPWFNVGKNIRIRNPGSSQEDVVKVLSALRLDSRVLGMWPYELSLGMYKRIEFASALLHLRRVLILDEFFSSLDHDSRSGCMELLTTFNQNRIVILTTHTPESVSVLKPRKLLLRNDSNIRTITSVVLD